MDRPLLGIEVLRAHRERPAGDPTIPGAGGGPGIAIRSVGASVERLPMRPPTASPSRSGSAPPARRGGPRPLPPRRCRAAPRQVPVNAAVRRTIVVADRGRGVAPHVGRLVRREEHRDGPVDTTLADPPRRHRASTVPPLPTAAVVGELHPHLVLARRDRLVTVDLELLQPEEVVTVGRLSVLRVELRSRRTLRPG